jgi:hypothetical protein
MVTQNILFCCDSLTLPSNLPPIRGCFDNTQFYFYGCSTISIYISFISISPSYEESSQACFLFYNHNVAIIRLETCQCFTIACAITRQSILDTV